MRNVIGVGVLGLDSIGRSHARALDALRDRAALRAFSGGEAREAEECGWPNAAHVSAAALCTRDDVDVVAICSPSDRHAEHAIAALEQGKHVLIEKPIALTVRDADRIIRRAADRDLLVSAVSQRRLEREVVAVHQAFEEGTLGALRLATTHVHWWRGEDYYAAAPWRGHATAGGGSLMNQGVHNVDLLRWFAGPVDTVTAQQATLAHGSDAEDTMVSTVRFTSGALGLISTSTATPPGDRATLSLYCARGVVEIGQGELLRWDVEGAPAPVYHQTGPRIGAGVSDPNAIGIVGHIQQWEDLLDALRDSRAPVVTGEDGAETVRLLEAISTAARTGRAVAMEELR